MAQDRPRKVAFLSHSAVLGGAEKCLLLLLQGLDRDRYRPLVLLPNSGPLDHELLALGVETRLVDCPWWVGSGDADWQTLERFGQQLDSRVAALSDLFRSEAIELVVTNTSVVADGALAARQCGLPHIWHVLEMMSRDPVLRPALSLEHFYSLMTTLSERIVVVSESVHCEILQYCHTDIVRVVHTGLPENEQRDIRQPAFDPVPAKTGPRVAFVGVLSQRKGITDLLEAAPAVVRRHPNARFIVVGPDGGELSAAERIVERHALAESIHFLGQRSDVNEILAESELFVLPTLADPLPLVVLEAMRAGLPVVATRSGGCEEMVVDGETGYLVDIGDRDALANRMIDLLDRPDARRRMGDNGRRRFQEQFTHRRYVEQFGEVMDDVLSLERAVSSPRETTWNGCLLSLLQEVALCQAKLRTVAILQTEIDAMKASAFWRLRERVLAWPGGRSLADYLGRRNNARHAERYADETFH